MEVKPLAGIVVAAHDSTPPGYRKQLELVGQLGANDLLGASTRVAVAPARSSTRSAACCLFDSDPEERLEPVAAVDPSASEAMALG